MESGFAPRIPARAGRSPVRAELLLAAARRLPALAQRLLLAVAGAVFLAIAIVPHLGWYRPVTVLSGSMRPTFSEGDLIIVRPMPLRDVKVGDVISYQVPVGLRQVETHRVVEVLERGPNPVVRTQGDANSWPDPWAARLDGDTAWRLSLVVPYVGYGVNALRSRTLHLLAIYVAPALLAAMMLARMWGLAGLLGRRPKLRGATR
jgi:signal peptidase I